MKHRVTLFYLGDSVGRHPVLRLAIERALEARGLIVAEEIFCRDYDAEIPLKLQKIPERESSQVLIVCDKEAFALAGRLLSTLNQDTLHLSGETLLPSRAIEIREESYLYRIGEKQINVMQCSLNRDLPEILLEPAVHRTYHLFLSDLSFPEDLKEALFSEIEAAEWIEILPGWVRIELYGEENLNELDQALRPWRDRMIPGDSLVESLIGYYAAQKRKITFAESCTGGLLASTFTSQPGASEILEGSYVTYANRIKSAWLGVREETLKLHGAVSAECVREMARGAKQRLDADLAVAISGIAGPTGAVPGKPVGTVFICLINGDREIVRRLQLHGDRNAVQQNTVLHTLKMIVESEEKIFDFFAKNP